MPSRAKLRTLNELLAAVAPDGDAYNCTWPGFREGSTLGLGIYLPGVVSECLEQFGPPGQRGATNRQRVEYFRECVDGSGYPTSGYFCSRISARNGKSAWLAFRQNDAAEVEVIGVYRTPVDFENTLRAEGMIFPDEGDVPPSGRNDTLTDKQIIERLKTASRKKRR